MLVTFRTKAWSSITLFGDVAEAMLRMAGHGGSIPGAFAAEDVPAAHARLRAALMGARANMPKAPARQRGESDEEDESVLDRALRLGAEHPLVHLLAAAASQSCEVSWAEGAPVV